MSSVVVKETDLPVELTAEQAVEAAYAHEIAEVTSKLQRGLPSLIECDKDLGPYLYINLRNRLRAANLRCLYLDGRPDPNAGANAIPMGMIGTMINQLRDAVRGAVEKRVIVLPHLDLLTTSQGGLTAEAREVIPLLYENPELVWMGFKDPSFPLPKVIENLFTFQVSILGTSRTRLKQLITRKESRKFGKEFNPWALYKHVSGVNAVKLRKLLSTLEGEDYPTSPVLAYRQLRQATVGATMEVPSIDLDKDIGGYKKVKERLKGEILDIMKRKDALTEESQIKAMEALIPRGMLLWGPPGTGKTLFSKSIATALGAAIQVVSGPELKSKWVGESEDNLRQIFHKARQSAPSIIVFDELDSFASARGTYTGSGVEHSMVNQLLTEMDGFHKDEMVFVVGTTNFVESIDPALLRPGRFEFHLHIPYPDGEARKEIIRIYDKKMNLKMTEAVLDYAVKRTDFLVPGAASGTLFSGDHLNALCRSIARKRLREAKENEETTNADIDRALTEWIEPSNLTPHEEQVIATHEAGHAVCALFTPHAKTIERIALSDDVVGALGYVRHQEAKHRNVRTQKQMLADLVVLMGGRAAEKIFFEDLTWGATQDLTQATELARDMVEVFGMGGSLTGAMRYRPSDERKRADLSQSKLEDVDARVRELLDEAVVLAEKTLLENKEVVAMLRDELVDKKVVEAASLKELMNKYELQNKGTKKSKKEKE